MYYTLSCVYDVWSGSRFFRGLQIISLGVFSDKWSESFPLLVLIEIEPGG